jgi:hypothetical protein
LPYLTVVTVNLAQPFQDFQSKLGKKVMIRARPPPRDPLAFPRPETADGRIAVALGIAQPVNDTGLVDILGGHFHFDGIPDGDLDKVLPELTGDMGKDLVAVLEFNPEHGPGKDSSDFPFYFYDFGFRHMGWMDINSLDGENRIRQGNDTKVKLDWVEGPRWYPCPEPNLIPMS